MRVSPPLAVRLRRAHARARALPRAPQALDVLGAQSVWPFGRAAWKLHLSRAVDEAPTGLLRLNLATRSFHDPADDGWLGLLGRNVTRADYMRQLVTTYGFEAPVEAALAYTPNLKLFLDLRQRSRAGLIAGDLLALGLRANEVSRLPQCPLPPFGGAIEALGWLYVTERATLLHERVRRHLLAHLPDAHDVCSYVSAYDGVANARWNELGHAIDRAARSPAQVDQLIAAAAAGFGRLIDWSHHAGSVARGA